MKLNEKQLADLMRMVAGARPDCLDCDGCYGHIAEYAEHRLKSLPISKAMEDVERHLKQCPCCHVEFEALLAGLQAIQDAEQATPESDQQGDPSDQEDQKDG